MIFLADKGKWCINFIMPYFLLASLSLSYKRGACDTKAIERHLKLLFIYLSYMTNKITKACPM